MDDYGWNITDNFQKNLVSPEPEFYIVPVVFAIIFIVGLVGNGTVIHLFIKKRIFRNGPNIFIASLTIGDLLVILLCVPFFSTVYTAESWSFGLTICKISEFVKDLSQCVSVYTLLAFSVCVHYGIVNPTQQQRNRKELIIQITSVVGVWSLSGLLALPTALHSRILVVPGYYPEESDEVDDFKRNLQICYPFPVGFGFQLQKAMRFFHFIAYYVFPLLVIRLFYNNTSLSSDPRNIPPSEAEHQMNEFLGRRKITKTILSLVVSFAICMFPDHLFLLWFYFYPDADLTSYELRKVWKITAFCLRFAKSCINPIILYWINKTENHVVNEQGITLYVF